MIVTFVCTANICRSAYAEVTARHRLAEAGAAGVSVFSAGTWGLTGRPMCPEMAVEAERRGASTASFRASRLDRELVDRSDLLLTAEAAHRQFLLDDWPRAVRRVATLRQFARTLAGADPGLSLADLVADTRVGRAGRADTDVTDPFGRGPAAAAACAAELDALLDVIVPRLAGLALH